MPDGNLSGKIILVVDDEPDLITLVGDAIRDLGGAIVEAAGGIEALEILKTQHVDAIVSDVKMANGDGFYILESLKERGVAIPLVLTSGNSEMTEAKAKLHGASALLLKPYRFNELTDCVQRVLCKDLKKA